MSKGKTLGMDMVAFICVLVIGGAAAMADTIYVSAGADGLNDGSTWTDAYTSLQDGLDAADPCDQIWVTEGMYLPSKQTDPCDPRTATFQLINGVGIYGGFPDMGDPAWEDRDPDSYVTILSGDLVGNDVPVVDPCELLDDPCRADNCYHVFYHPSGTNLDPTATLDGFTITAGNADMLGFHQYIGGGMYNELNNNPTVTNCTFTGNSAYYWGGGMSNWDSNPTVTDCTFTRNSASRFGGGGMYNTYSSPKVSNCEFNGNWAYFSGGGMYNYDNSGPTVTNCTFTDNSVDFGAGGGMCNEGSNPTVTDCTFTRNSVSGIGGGGMFNSGNSDPTVSNCILWGNTAVSEGNEIYNYDISSTPVISYCDIAGSSGSSASWDPNLGTDGGGNIDANPCFVDADGDDDIFGTEDDNLRLLSSSPCIDAGDNTVVPPETKTDLDGLPRFIDDPDTNDTGNGTAPIVDMGAYEYVTVIYVDSTAGGNNNGASWKDAFISLQDGLDEADPCDQIWVTEGMYLPSKQTDPCDPRTATFQMINSVAIYGGFPDTGDPVWGERDPNVYATILSGDLLGNDVDVGDPCKLLDDPCRAENCYHVFYHPYGINLDSTAILDGFTITAGNADGSELHFFAGGGMYNEYSSPTVTYCTFSGNSASWDGGGMYNLVSKPVLAGCTFQANSASSGGGIFNNQSETSLYNCMIEKNSAILFGGEWTT